MQCKNPACENYTSVANTYCNDTCFKEHTYQQHRVVWSKQQMKYEQNGKEVVKMALSKEEKQE